MHLEHKADILLAFNKMSLQVFTDISGGTTKSTACLKSLVKCPNKAISIVS